jgi:predicted N-acetyltransferase YhbS
LNHFSIVHLFEQPQHRAEVAELIHEEFWVTVAGASAEKMAARLAQASRADRVPLCRVALHGGRPVGAVNLVDNDDEQHADWHPWLAGMVVDRAFRGRGVGSALVRTLLRDAASLGFERLYFGTSCPGFYERLGAVVHQQPRPGFCFMRFEGLGGGRGAAP